MILWKMKIAAAIPKIHAFFVAFERIISFVGCWWRGSVSILGTQLLSNCLTKEKNISQGFRLFLLGKRD